MRRKRNRKKKNSDLFRHFCERMLVRYNIIPTKNDVDLLISQIKKGNCLKLYTLSNRVKIYEVVIQDKIIPILYDSDRKFPITAYKWKYLNDLYTKYEEVYDNSLDFTFSETF